MATLKQKTLHSIKWKSIASFTNTGFTFLLSLILARLLSPSDYGIVGMTSIFFGIASIFIDSGLGSAVIRKKDLTNTDISTVFYFNIITSGIFCVTLCLLSSQIASFLNTPILTNIIKLSALSMLIGSFGSIQFSLMSRNLDFKTPAIIRIGSNFITGIFGVVLAYKGFGPWALVGQSFLGMVLLTVLVWIFSKWRPIASFSKKSFKELFSFGGNIAINSILDKIYSEGTSMLIGKFYSPSDLGYYSKGQHNAQMPSTFIANIIGGVTYPILSKIQDDEKQLRRIYGKFMRILSFGIFFAMILLFSISKPFIVFLYSEKWLPTVIFLQIFCLKYMLYHVNMVNWYLILAKGRSDLALKKEFFCKTINFGLLFFSIQFGVVAICCSLLAGSIVGIIVNTYVSGKYFHYGFKDQCSDFLPYLLKAGIACIPAYFIAQLDMHPLIQILSASIISSVIYFGYHFWVKDECLYELIALSPAKNFLKTNKNE